MTMSDPLWAELARRYLRVAEEPDMTLKAGTCRTCGAPIIWALTAKSNKWIPLDADPVKDGNIVLTPERQTAVYLQTGWDRPPSDMKRYRSHFSTCPDAKGWRR